jgi:TP901 family phage tail tape measure protein
MSLDKQIRFLLTATDQTGSVFSSVGDRVSSMGEEVKGATQPFADIAANVLKLDAALAAMVGGGLALAVAESGKFNAAFSETTTLFAAAPENIDRYRSDLLAYAAASRSSIEDINAATYSAISAGTDYADSLSLVGIGEQLAIAGRAGLNDATVLLASSLNAYGASVDQAEGYSDALFTTVRAGQTTLPELAASLAQVTGVAASSGVSFDDLLSAVAALTAAGLPTSQAVSSIKGALSNILKPSTDAAEVAATLGFEFNATALASKGLGGFMSELGVKAGGNIDVMSKLFGSIEGLNGALVLTGTGAEKFADTQDEMAAKAGATSVAYTKMADELDQTNQRLANNTQLALIAVGDQIRDDYTDMIGALVEVFQTLEQAVRNGTFDGLFEVIETAFNRAQAGLENIAKNLPTALASVDLGGLAASFGGMFDGVELASAEGLAQAIQAVVDSLESLVTFSRGIVDGLKPFIGILAEAVEWFNGLDDSTKTAVATLTGVATALNLIAGPLSVVGSGISLVGKGLSGLSGATGVVSKLAVAFTGLGAAVAVVGASTAAVGLAIKGYYEWQIAEDQAAAAEDRAAQSAEALVAKYEAISAATGVAISSTNDLRAATAAGTIHFDEATRSWQAGAVAQRDFAAEVADAADKSYDYRNEIEGMVDAQGNLIGALTESTLVNQEAIATADKQAAALEKQKEKTADLGIELEKLASNEHIKSMEFAVSLDLAQIEADTAKVEALMALVGESISSSGDVMGDLLGSLDSADSLGDKWKLQAQLDDEIDRRQAAFDSAQKLTEQQIKLNDLRLERVEKGDAMIKVSADGLGPALEMVLFEIVERIQIRVNEEADPLLLGS